MSYKDLADYVGFQLTEKPTNREAIIRGEYGLINNTLEIKSWEIRIKTLILDSTDMYGVKVVEGLDAEGTMFYLETTLAYPIGCNIILKNSEIKISGEICLNPAEIMDRPAIGLVEYSRNFVFYNEPKLEKINKG